MTFKIVTIAILNLLLFDSGHMTYFQ